MIKVSLGRDNIPTADLYLRFGGLYNQVILPESFVMERRQSGEQTGIRSPVGASLRRFKARSQQNATKRTSHSNRVQIPKCRYRHVLLTPSRPYAESSGASKRLLLRSFLTSGASRFSTPPRLDSNGSKSYSFDVLPHDTGLPACTYYS